jgi:tRNA-specific 2-thiouridylase
MGKAGAEMHRAFDPTRDQSYFLFATTQNQLDFLRFPLGGMPKSETRDHALRFGLEVADKPDSQDICFVPNGSYVSVLEKLRPGCIEEGEIIHVDGRVLGHHKGIIHYTVGQRKGLGIGGGDPLYVVRLNAEKHQVIVGPYEALGRQEIRLKDVNWIGGPKRDSIQCEVKVRSTRPPAPAELVLEGENAARISFPSPEYGVAAGQACVFYEGSRVLGGGWIVNQSSRVAE